MALKKINKNAQGVPTGEYTDVAGGTLYADVGIGTILPFGGTSDKIPQGYLLCNGTSLLRAFYPELFAVIGTAFGSADSTHFNIPDLRGEFLRGAGTNSHTNQGSGGVVGAHQDSTTVPYMSNRADDNTVVTEQVAPTGGNRANVLNSDSAYKITTNSVYGAYQAPLASTTAAQQLTVRPTNTSVNFIIKAKMVALPADLASGVEEVVEDVYGDVIPSDASASNKVITRSIIGVNSSASHRISSSVTGAQVLAEAIWGIIKTDGSPESGVMPVMYEGHDYGIVMYGYLWEGTVKWCVYTLFLMASGTYNFRAKANVGTDEVIIYTS